MAQLQGTPKTSSRYHWVDYAKGIAIFLVVYRHVFEGLKRANLEVENFMGLEYANIVFFSFRMPLFFIVSGMFISASLAKRGLNPLLTQKAKTILYPYFLWGILQITLQLVLASYVNSSRTLSDYLLLLYAPRGVDQFWYLYALFNVTALYVITKSLFSFKASHQLILGAIFYYFSAIAAQNEWDLGFINDIFHYYIFFAIGDLANSWIRNDKTVQQLGSWKTVLALIPFFVISQGYFLYANLQHDEGKYQFVEVHQPNLFLLIALTGCLFMISISFLLQRFEAAKWLRTIGFHSLYIYVSHVFVTSAVRILLIKFAGLTYVPALLVIAIAAGIFIPILFYKFCMARGWYLVFTFDKPQPKKLA